MRSNICAIGALALLATAGSANAAEIIGTDFEQGRKVQVLSVDGVDITLNASPRGVVYVDGGAGGIGVSGGGGDDQIGSVDEFNFEFSKPVYIHQMTLSRLFAKGRDGDIVDEKVRVTTDNGSWIVTAVDAVRGTIFTNQDFGGDKIFDGGGRWILTDNLEDGALEGGLFGGPITFMKLDPVDEGIWPFYSDFTFRNMTVTPVPAPATAALAGLGLLGASRRRRRA